jgi:hypothetical protein
MHVGQVDKGKLRSDNKYFQHPALSATIFVNFCVFIMDLDGYIKVNNL